MTTLNTSLDCAADLVDDNPNDSRRVSKQHEGSSESQAIPQFMNPGHIYLLKNPAYRDNYHKLGKTTDTVEKRARKLSQPTGVPSEFRIVYQHWVVDCDKAENMAKERLQPYRVAGTEFFDLPQNEATNILIAVTDTVNAHSSDEEECLFANTFFQNIRGLFETRQVHSLSGDALKIRLLYLLSPAYSRLSFTLKEFVDKTGISEDRVIDLLKQLGIQTEEQIWHEQHQEEKEMCREIEEEDMRNG